MLQQKQDLINQRERILQRQINIKQVQQWFFKDRETMIKTCPIHGIDYETFSESENYCPLCLKELEDKERQELKLQSVLQNIDGLLKRYTNAGFKNYEVTPQNEMAYKTVLAFAKEPKNKWLLLLGENGTGKTHLANAVLKVTGGIYREFPNLAMDLQDAQNGYSDGMKRAIKKYETCPVLVIDEIDKIKATEGRIDWLNIILRYRYNELLPVVFCGNIDVKTLCSKLDINGGKAMKDRINEVGEVVLFNWESHRPKMRNA